MARAARAIRLMRARAIRATPRDKRRAIAYNSQLAVSFPPTTLHSNAVATLSLVRVQKQASHDDAVLIKMYETLRRTLNLHGCTVTIFRLLTSVTSLQ